MNFFIEVERLFKKRTFVFLLIIVFMAMITALFVYVKFLGIDTKNKEEIPSNEQVPLINREDISTEKEIESPNLQDVKPFSSDPSFEVLGYSEKGKEIIGYILGNGAETILFFGAIHGNEKGSSILLQQIVEELNKNIHLVGANKKVIIIPTLNPDGYAANWEKVNANNVNLNLNFETMGWKNYGGEGGRYFAGPRPFSESESRLLRDTVVKYKVKKMLSYHAKGSLVNPEIHAPSEELARWYVSRTGYRFYEDPSWDYPGTATKWFTEVVGGPAITIELSDYMNSDFEKNKKAIFELIK